MGCESLQALQITKHTCVGTRFAQHSFFFFFLPLKIFWLSCHQTLHFLPLHKKTFLQIVKAITKYLVRKVVKVGSALSLTHPDTTYLLPLSLSSTHNAESNRCLHTNTLSSPPPVVTFTLSLSHKKQHSKHSGPLSHTHFLCLYYLCLSQLFTFSFSPCLI